ncbi:MAG: prefoldin subunit beta [Desulfurococcaceae archaeon]
MSEKPLPPEVQQMIIQYQTMRDHYARIDAELKLIEAELSDVNNILDILRNVGDDAELYKVVGHVLIKRSKSDIVKELEERKEILIVKRDKYKKQLEFLNRQINELENRLKELLTKYGITIG